MNEGQLKMFIADQRMKLVEAMQKIDINGNGILFVVDSDSIMVGTVSDGDIRRWILNAGNIETDISYMMNRKPVYVTENVYLRDPLNYMNQKGVRALPVLDTDGRIADIFLAKELENIQSVAKGGLERVVVVVMAGGKGTRLYPYTQILPKPLIPIGDIPIVERILDSFYEYGITDFIISINYKKNMIKYYFAETAKQYNIEYVEENCPLGTCGSLKLIKKEFTQPIIVTNCDILVRIDYKELYTYHIESGNTITIVAAMKKDTIPYGVIYSKENGEIDRMIEKPTRSYLINTGMYVIEPGIIDLIPDNEVFHMTDLSELAMGRGYKVGIYPISEDSFLDMGEFEEMKRMEEKIGIIKFEDNQNR